MPHETEEDLLDWVEHIMEFSLTIMQSGKPLLWTIAGALDKFDITKKTVSEVAEYVDWWVRDKMKLTK